jgi:ABC-type uncharacterized transport system substrate-binding protein
MTMIPRTRSMPTTLLAAALAALPAIARAHPHVWVTTHIDFIYSAAKLTALRQTWTFDAQFSSMTLGDQAPDHTVGQPLTKAEIAQLRDHAFANLAHYDYFTHVWSGSAPVKLGLAHDFTASVSGQKLTYVFTVPLAAPVDPTTAPLVAAVWDDSYYVDLEPATAQATSQTGASPCHATVFDDKAHPIYFGTVIPQSIRIACP